MIEEARASLDKFLHTNIAFLKKTQPYGNNDPPLMVLRNTWLFLNPQYKEYDINLDVQWEGLSGVSSLLWTCWCGCCGDAPKPPMAKNFKVVTRQWDDELSLHNKAKMCEEKWARMREERENAKKNAKRSA